MKYIYNELKSKSVIFKILKLKRKYFLNNKLKT